MRKKKGNEMKINFYCVVVAADESIVSIMRRGCFFRILRVIRNEILEDGTLIDRSFDRLNKIEDCKPGVH